jgi:hypothetical protein
MDAIGILTVYPALALVPGFAFLAIYWRTRRAFPLLVTGAWLLYGLYEEGMRRRILCSGECNMRVDLLLLYPALLVLSAVVVVRYLQWRRG